MIETEKYHVPDEVDESLFNLQNDPNGVIKSCLLESQKARIKEIADMKRDRQAMYPFIFSKLSRESEDAVKRHDDYEEFNKVKDVLDLWLAIKSTHLVSTASRVDAVIRKAARDDYFKCKQGEYESISS